MVVGQRHLPGQYIGHNGQQTTGARTGPVYVRRWRRDLVGNKTADVCGKVLPVSGELQWLDQHSGRLISAVTRKNGMTNLVFYSRGLFAEESSVTPWTFGEPWWCCDCCECVGLGRSVIYNLIKQRNNSSVERLIGKYWIYSFYFLVLIQVRGTFSCLPILPPRVVTFF